MRKTKTLWVHSLIALLLCASMLIGTTFAWFTDTVTSSNNVITAGNLDLEMYWTYDLSAGTWYNVEEDEYNTIFGYDNWEPGYTEVRYIKLVNKGNLALNYQLSLTPQGTVGKLAEVIDVYYGTDGVAVSGRDAVTTLTHSGLLNDLAEGGVAAKGALLPEGATSTEAPSGEVIVTLAMSMQTTAGNEYQEETIGDAGFTVTALATQQTFEKDSFGDDYDEDATYPEGSEDSDDSVEIKPDGGTVAVTPGENGELTASVTVSGTTVTATLPQGVKLAEGTSEVKLTVTPLEETTGNVTLEEGESIVPLDVHIEGIAEENDTAIIVSLGKVLPVGLNMGNIKLYHVENGVTNEMTRVALEELDEHNEYYYDAATGEVTVAMASFSEITFTFEPAKWKGNRTYDWLTREVPEDMKADYVIANADELAGLSAVVGGMDDQTINSFEGKTIKLINDIDLNDVNDNEDASENGRVFYPIGYYNNTGSYTRTNATNIVSGFKPFKGTFDGNGHKISNFYQNTWEMFGDYNDGYSAGSNYYRDGMGLFGKVYGGTVKNLTIHNFSSDGEFTTTGCVAAYADCGATFENIAITNCNPRVYNIGNGGIVGCVGWYASEDGDNVNKVKFNNITVDNSNKISALWGSWDVACGGLVGQYYPTSGQSDAIKNPGIKFTDCHVAAQIDVNNDVCANYQYYAYRYAGMIIGSIRENVTGEDGRSYPKLDGLEASDCTVNYGDWNAYYYCELVANSLASYTHDHQMSRLTWVEDVYEEDGIWKYVPLNSTREKAVEVSPSGSYNFVVVSKTADGKWNHGENNAKCFHFVNGTVHDHDKEGTQVIDGNTIPVEDHRHIYLPFVDQLFTGYGWGVTSRGIKNLEGIEDITFKVTDEGTEDDSAEKFKYIGRDSYETGKTVRIGEIFAAKPGRDVNIKNSNIDSDNVKVFVSPADENSTVSAEYTRRTANLWGYDQLTFHGTGKALLTITDYYFCKPTTVEIEIKETIPAPTKTIYIDFKEFAVTAAKDAASDPNHWWNAMEKAFDSDKVNGRWTGRYADKPKDETAEDTGAMTAEQVAAYDAMLAEMKADYGKGERAWYLDESVSNLKNSKLRKGFWMWGDDSTTHWGMAFYSATLDNKNSDFAFVVRVDEAGMYEIDMRAFYEFNQGGTKIDDFHDPSTAPGKDGYSGSGRVDILVNGELIVDDFNLYGTYENGMANLQDLVNYMGKVWLDEGENTVTIRPATDLDGAVSSHRRYICLRYIKLSKVGDCPAEHEIKDDVYYCEICGELIGTNNENITYIDFKYSAKKASQQGFWKDLRTSEGDKGSTKLVGFYETGMTVEEEDGYAQVDAYDDLRSYLWANHGWTIDEDATDLKVDSGTSLMQFMLFNGEHNNLPWGIAYMSNEWNNIDRRDMSLTVDVEKDGMYDVDLCYGALRADNMVHEYSELNTTINGSGYADIYVNGRLVEKDHYFTGKAQEEKITLKTNLKEGPNTITFVITNGMDGKQNRHTLICLKSLKMTWKSNLTYTIDFKEFAKDASEQTWWNELMAAGSTKFVGIRNNSVNNANLKQMNESQLKAYDSMLSYMYDDQTLGWYIDEENTGLKATNIVNRGIWFSAGEEAPWGIAYLSSDFDDATKDVLTLKVWVDQDGIYNVNTTAFYESDNGILKAVTDETAGLAGSGYADVLVNGLSVLPDGTDSYAYSGYSGPNNGKANKLDTDTVGAGIFNKGWNTITINTVKDYKGETNSLRRAICLKSIDLVWTGDCDHECDYTVGDPNENLKKCENCGKYVIDFKQFAEDAQTNAATEDTHWWNNLRYSAGSDGEFSKFFGSRKDTSVMTPEQVGAYDDMCDNMLIDYGWQIANTAQELQNGTNEGIWLNGGSAKWGLAYLSADINSDNELTLKVNVPQAGEYAIDMYAFHEAITGGTFHNYTEEGGNSHDLTGSGYARILVNGVNLLENDASYAFSAAGSSPNYRLNNQLKNVELGKVKLEAGENTITIQTTGDYGNTNDSFRRVICLNSIALEYLGEAGNSDSGLGPNDPTVMPVNN